MKTNLNLTYWKIGKEYLSKFQYEVLYNNKTEKPRENAYWNFNKRGLYVDPTNGTILFTSYDKYFSQCGWPTFLKPYEKNALVFLKDKSYGEERIEIRTKESDLHLGHVFNDISINLLNKGYQRYCINSAAIKFISEQEINSSNESFYKEVWNSEIAKHSTLEKTLYLAGGCFWGIELLFKQLPGVLTTETGYANSKIANPSYEKVCTGETNAVETVKINFNLEYVSIARILELFFANINPLQLNAQANDIGSQYRSGIYFSDLTLKPVLESLFKQIYFPKFPKMVTELLLLENYYSAEEKHQDYLIKNPNGYCHIDFKNYD